MRAPRPLLAALLLVGLSVPVAALALPHAGAAPAADPPYSGPLTITRGGTYSGDWASTDPDTPAVTVATDEPVVLQDARLRGPGDLVATSVGGADLTVRNSSGYGLNSGVRGRANGVFVHAGDTTRLVVEHDYVEGTDFGVLANGHAGPRDAEHSITIRYNRGRNMTGRHSDGNGGYLPAHTDSDRSWSHFIQLADIHDLAGMEIAWNEAVDEPFTSLVDDVVNIYRAGGTADSPLRIHDNYIQGAYPDDPTVDTYSGGGIITDGNHDTAAEAPAHVVITDNQVVASTNYGVALSNGHDNEISGNRVVASGRLPDGRPIFAQNVGIYVSDIYGGNVPGSMFGNSVHDNVSGWERPVGTTSNRNGPADLRGDYYFSTPDTVDSYGHNGGLDHDPSSTDEQAELTGWQRKLADAGIAPGPTGTGTGGTGGTSTGTIAGLAGKCLDVSGAGTADGTQIVLYGCHGGANQQWTVNGSEVHSALGGCLDVSNGSTADEAKVQLWQCNGTVAQRWNADHGQLTGPGGKCLDVWGNGDVTADGTTV